MMDFEGRLDKAIQRGYRTGDARARAEAEKALSQQELRRLHTQYRLELNEHIDACLQKLAGHFPGFRFQTLLNERGWGAALSRDDTGVGPDRRRANFFSHLEMLIRPLGKYSVLELAAKGTIRNKELFNRTHFQRLGEVDLASFTELVDLWTLEYAELYAAKC